MTVQAILQLALLLSLSLIVFSLGLRASVRRLGYVLGRPAAFGRAMLAIYVAVPAFAILVAATTSLPAPIRFALVAMSAAPIAPILAYKQMKAGADEDYAVGLVVAAALVSLVATPLLVALAASLLGAEASVSVAEVLKVLVISTVLLLAAGMLVRALSERLAVAIQDGVQRAGNLLLLATFAAVVVATWREIVDLLGGGGALAIAATVAAGLLAGHLLGGRDSAGLALASASRHPGVAMAIAGASFPDQRPAILVAVVLFLIVNALVTKPYVRLMAGRQVALGPSPVGPKGL
jgi:bile acid:Na+ symporter, BASS family